MEESISNMVDGLLLESQPVVPPTVVRYGVDTPTQSPSMSSSSVEADNRLTVPSPSFGPDPSQCGGRNLEFHARSPTAASQDLLNHLNNVLISIPNAPPTPTSPVRSYSESVAAEKDKFNQNRAEIFRFDPVQTPFGEDIVCDLESDEGPDTSALAAQLMRHQEQQQQQKVSVSNLAANTENSQIPSCFVENPPANFEVPANTETEGSSLVDGLNKLALSQKLGASFGSENEDAFRPKFFADDSPLDGFPSAGSLPPTPISLSSTPSFGAEQLVAPASGSLGTPKSAGFDSKQIVEPPTFFSTPYSSCIAEKKDAQEPCMSLSAIFEVENESSQPSVSRFRPNAMEFKPQSCGKSDPHSRPGTPAPFSAPFRPVPSMPSQVNLNVQQSNFGDSLRSSSVSTPSPLEEAAPSVTDYEDRPKNARDRAAYLLEREREKIHELSANALEQMRQAYVTTHDPGYSKRASVSSSRNDSSLLESSGESFASSGVHSDSSGDLSQLCNFVEKQLQKIPGPCPVSTSAVSATDTASTQADDVFQRLLKQIPLHDSQLPPPPPIYAPNPPPTASQLTSLLRQRIMPPSPLTLNPAGAGFADGFAAAAAALSPALPAGFSTNAVARRALNGSHSALSPLGGHISPGYRQYSASPQSPYAFPSSGLGSSFSGDATSLSAGLEWPQSPNELFGTSPDDPYSIERAARLYRSAATICEATCTWSGSLPPKIYRNPIYSCKVFIGGVPWDITEIGLLNTFKCYGNLRIEWPGKDGKHPKYPPKGYVYILFDCEKSVKELLKQCTHDYSNGGEYYYKMSSRRMRCKEVQVIPWVLTDSNFIRCPSQRLDPQKTVFVGALHGMLNSEALATIFNDLFGGVVYAGVDTDKHKYPIGSGRVTFNNHKSFMKAVNAAFIEVKTAKFTKKIQVDPYLEDSPCCLCTSGGPGPYFCRDLQCFKYYCRPCWSFQHSTESFRHHKPLMRNSKSHSGFGIGSAFGGLAAGTLGQLMAGMSTFSNANHDNLEMEDTDDSVHSYSGYRNADSIYSSGYTGIENVYPSNSNYENPYSNALCAELTNMLQYNMDSKKVDQTVSASETNPQLARMLREAAAMTAVTGMGVTLGDLPPPPSLSGVQHQNIGGISGDFAGAMTLGSASTGVGQIPMSSFPPNLRGVASTAVPPLRPTAIHNLFGAVRAPNFNGRFRN